MRSEDQWSLKCRSIDATDIFLSRIQKSFLYNSNKNVDRSNLVRTSRFWNNPH